MGGQGGGPRARISNKFPDAASAGGEPQLANHCLRTLENSKKMDGKCPACVNLAAGWPQALQAGAELGFGGKVWGCGGWEAAHGKGSPLGRRTLMRVAASHLQVSTGAYKRQVHEVPLGKQVTEAVVIEKITWASWTRWLQERSQGRLLLSRPQPQVCVGLGSEAAQRQSSFPWAVRGGKLLAPRLGHRLWSDLGFWNAKSLLLCNLSHPSPAAPNKSKGKHLPALGQAPSSTVRPPPTPGTGREGRSPGSRVSSRALPSQKRGDHQPGDLRSPHSSTKPTLRSTTGKRERTNDGGNVSFGVKGARGREQQGAGASAEGEGAEEPRGRTDSPLLPGEAAWLQEALSHTSHLFLLEQRSGRRSHWHLAAKCRQGWRQLRLCDPRRPEHRHGRRLWAGEALWFSVHREICEFPLE